MTTHPPQAVMRRAVLTLLAALGVGAGLAVSASSTTHVAFEHGMRGLALAAIVVVLEVTNTLGTWVLLTDGRRHAVIEAVVLVAAASLVTGWCGVLTYGPIGLVGPFFVLGGVELARLGSSAPPRSSTASSEAESEAAREHAGETAEPPAEPEVDKTPESDSAPEPEREPESVPADEADRIADLREYAASLGRMPGRDAVKERYCVGSTTAERLREAAAKPDLRIAGGA